MSRSKYFIESHVGSRSNLAQISSSGSYRTWIQRVWPSVVSAKNKLLYIWPMIFIWCITGLSDNHTWIHIFMKSPIIWASRMLSKLGWKRHLSFSRHPTTLTRLNLLERGSNKWLYYTVRYMVRRGLKHFVKVGLYISIDFQWRETGQIFWLNNWGSMWLMQIIILRESKLDSICLHTYWMEYVLIILSLAWDGTLFIFIESFFQSEVIEEL